MTWVCVLKKKNQLRNLLKSTVGNLGWGILPYPEIHKTLEKTNINLIINIMVRLFY